MEVGERTGARRRRDQRKRFRLARPAQLGARARDRLQGLHHPLRRDRRSRRAVRRGGARAPPRLSRPADGRACRMSSPGSPTGSSGGCWRSRRAAGISTRRRGCSTPRGWRGWSSIPRHALSFKIERDTEFRDTVVIAADRQFRLDARAADRHRRDLRRHPRPHARALRGRDRSARLHHPGLEGRAEPRGVAGRRAGRPIRAGSTTFATSSTSAPTSPIATPAATSG